MSGAKVPALGTLRDRVQLLRRVTTPDGAGGEEIAFVPMATVWARVTARNPALTTHGAGPAAQSTHSVVLRYRTDLTPGDRLTYRGQSLDVIAADDLNGRKAYLSVACVMADPLGGLIA